MSLAKTMRQGVTYHNPLKTGPGYTLFSTYNHDVWLIDMQGSIVNRWRMPYRPGAHQLLLPNGHLLFAGVLRDHSELGLPVEMAAIGGVLLEVDWDSNLVWKAEVPYQNHDIHPLPNGHVLYHSYHPSGILPPEMAARLKGGRPGTEFNGQVWGDVVHEIDRQGRIVWEWKARDHLDPEIDALCPLENRTLWPYINSLWQCRDGTNLIGERGHPHRLPRRPRACALRAGPHHSPTRRAGAGERPHPGLRQRQPPPRVCPQLLPGGGDRPPARRNRLGVPGPPALRLLLARLRRVRAVAQREHGDLRVLARAHL